MCNIKAQNVALIHKKAATTFALVALSAFIGPNKDFVVLFCLKLKLSIYQIVLASIYLCAL